MGSRRIRMLILIILLISVVFMMLKWMPFIDGDFKSLKKVIVIDPGHGGRDPGAIGYNGSYEKDINLEISKRLIKELKSKGYKVILTRDKDEYIENTLRAQIANKKRARVFISIHGNSIEKNSSVDGVQVLYYPDRESTIEDLDNNQLGSIMLKSIIEGTSAKDRGAIAREDLIVLNETKMPAILIEYGFISNEAEEKLLLTDEYQETMVNSIVNGIEKYFSYNLGNK